MRPKTFVNLLVATFLLAASVQAAGTDFRASANWLASRGPQEEFNGRGSLYARLAVSGEGRVSAIVEAQPLDTRNPLREARINVRAGRAELSLGRVPTPYRYLVPLPTLLETADYPQVPLPLYAWGAALKFRGRGTTLACGANFRSGRKPIELATALAGNNFNPEADGTVALFKPEAFGGGELFWQVRQRLPGDVQFGGIWQVGHKLIRSVVEVEVARPWFTARSAYYLGEEAGLPSDGGYALLAIRPLSWLEFHGQVERYFPGGRDFGTLGVRLFDLERGAFVLDYRAGPAGGQIIGRLSLVLEQ